jgi:hypothetical protein
MIKFLILLLFFSLQLIAQTREVIYLDNFQLGKDVPEELVSKVRRRLPIIVTNQYSNLYAFIDDDDLKKMLKVLQQKQRTGCNDEEACKKLIDDYYNSDYRITVVLMKEGNKFILDFKMIRTKGEVDTAIYSTDFSISQADYFIDELSKEMLSKGKYKVNKQKAPLDITSYDIDISISGININNESSKTLNSISEKIVESYAKDKYDLYKMKILEADNDFKNKKYTNAIKIYKKIIKDWEEIIDQKTMQSLAELISDVHTRIQVSTSNLYQEQIKLLDSELEISKKSILTSKTIEPYLEKYRKMYYEYNNIESKYRINIISEALADRFSKISGAYFSYREKEIDLLHEKMDFINAKNQYSYLSGELKATAKIFPIYEDFLKRIIEKTNKVDITGRNYLRNKVRLHMQIADINNSKYNFDKDDSEKSKILEEYIEDISENMELARELIINNPLSEQESELIKEYNFYVNKINKNKKDQLAVLIDVREITEKEEVRLEKKKREMYESELFYSQLSHYYSTNWRSALFPGWGHLYNDQMRGAIYMTAAVIASFNALLCCLRLPEDENSSTNSQVTTNGNGEYLNIALINNPSLINDPNFVFALYYFNNQPDPLEAKQQSANAILVGVWAFSLLDSLLLTPFQMPAFNIPMAGKSYHLDRNTDFSISVHQPKNWNNVYQTMSPEFKFSFEHKY